MSENWLEEWNLHEERKDAWKVLKERLDTASSGIYDDLEDLLQEAYLAGKRGAIEG